MKFMFIGILDHKVVFFLLHYTLLYIRFKTFFLYIEQASICLLHYNL